MVKKCFQKIVPLVTILMLALALTACTNTTTEEEETQAQSQTSAYADVGSSEAATIILLDTSAEDN